MEAEDIKLCNCAGCRRELLGESMYAWRKSLGAGEKRRQPPMTYSRIDGRPYCFLCSMKQAKSGPSPAPCEGPSAT